MKHPANQDRSFAPEEMVNASELKDFLFCHLAWFLNQQGFRNTPRAIEERQVGIAFHEDRAEAARKAGSRQAVWWAIVLALLGTALLLVRALIESRRWRMLIGIAAAFFLAALILLLIHRRQRLHGGLPSGDLIYSDTAAQDVPVLVSERYGLKGKSDALVRTASGDVIPVERK